MGDPPPNATFVKPTNINKNIKKGLSILQWNASGLTSMGHGDKLKTFLTKSKINIDIICIQETWLYNKVKKSRLATTYEINGYTSLYTNQDISSRGGSSFFLFVMTSPTQQLLPKNIATQVSNPAV